jgi:diaminopimelate epimerase
MRRLAPFDKYEGLGNDFVVVEAAHEDEVSADLARALCDRRRGVGGDGVLLLLPGAGADVRMRVINSDGSVPEMCGNGLRCAVLHVARKQGLDRGELAVATDAGVRTCAFERTGDVAIVTADMGVVRVVGDVVVEVAGERVALTRVDAGNPHAVTFERRVTQEELVRIGQPLSTAAAFDGGVNVELVQVRGDARGLDVLVWERGAGATLACGTGACAAVAAAVRKGVLAGDGPVSVRLPGGELEVRFDGASGKTTMRGPARRVFAGSLAGGGA